MNKEANARLHEEIANKDSWQVLPPPENKKYIPRTESHSDDSSIDPILANEAKAEAAFERSQRLLKDALSGATDEEIDAAIDTIKVADDEPPRVGGRVLENPLSTASSEDIDNIVGAMGEHPLEDVPSGELSAMVDVALKETK
jgi:hypothetical protein